jgi:hypothetical protein
MEKRLLYSVVALLVCASVAAAASVDHSVFDNILRENVRNDRVDYAGIKANSMQDLNNYLDLLAMVDVNTLPRNEQLAFYINLYNATMIKAIIDRYRPGYSTADNDFAIFKAPIVRLKTGAISLNDLENKIIRPTFKEPRVHVALVCGARSCPPILNRAYHADDLDRVLEENMKWFVTDRFRNPIDDVNKELKLSHIFDWYADDFGGKDQIANYVWKYSGKNYSGYKISFVDYSWMLNEPAK